MSEEDYTITALYLSESDDVTLDHLEQVFKKLRWTKNDQIYALGIMLIYLARADDFWDLKNRIIDLCGLIFDDVIDVDEVEG